MDMDAEKLEILNAFVWRVQGSISRAKAVALPHSPLSFSAEWRRAVADVLAAAERLRSEANDVMEREGGEDGDECI